MVPNGRVCINYRMDRSLSHLKSLKPHYTHSIWFQGLIYANDCVLLSHSHEGLKEAISKLTWIYGRFGLEINSRKTKVLI